MAENSRQSLLSDFPPISTEHWDELINIDLKGADYEKRLVWRTEEGFDVRPYYRAEDLEGLKHLGAGIGEFPYVRSIGSENRWVIYQRVVVSDVDSANAMALRYISSGAEGINFHIRSSSLSSSDFDLLIKGVDFSIIEVTFSGLHLFEIAEMMLLRGQEGLFDPTLTRINFIIDPLVAEFSLRGAHSDDVFDSLSSLIKRGKAICQRFRFVGVEGHNFHNSGSTSVQELAFTLSAGHDYLVRLMEAGLSIDQAACSIRFSMGVGSSYFMEIAKFRAARMLWATIVAQYSPTCDASAKMLTHAVTSKWNITMYDPYVNMLRDTTEAMSAAIGGVHSLSVVPFNAAYEAPSDFSARIARNVQLLLKHESHFDNVVDVSGGSYYIENLTHSIAEQAWSLFKEVEDLGGYTKAFKSGFIQDRIESSSARKDMQVATRRISLLGTNQYPNFTEVAPKEDGKCCGCEADGGNDDIRTLKPYRGSVLFEKLRLRVDRSGRTPKAFMLTAGSLSMARARSLFSSNFFGCAGIRIIDNNFFDSVEIGVNEALKSGAEIVVLCGADDDYAELGPKVLELLDGRSILVIAGEPSTKSELEAQGVHNFISTRSNLLETLGWYLEALGIK